jgi:hypothetical protein
VVCDDLVMNGVFPLEDFNRYVAVSVLECLWMTFLEITVETLLETLFEESLILARDYTWDFIWVFVWNHVSIHPYINTNNIYMYSIYILLVTLLGITSVASGYVIGLFMFCFCLSFCKTVRSNTGKFYLLAMIKLYNMLFVGILYVFYL